MAFAACKTSADCDQKKYQVCIITKEAPGGICRESLEEVKFPVSTILKLDDDQQPQRYFKDTQYSPIVAFILSVIDFATIVIGSIAVILIIVTGFMFMFAQGNDQKLTEAKDILKYALIGLLVTFLSYTITTFVQSLFLVE